MAIDILGLLPLSLKIRTTRLSPRRRLMQKCSEGSVGNHLLINYYRQSPDSCLFGLIEYILRDKSDHFPLKFISAPGVPEEGDEELYLFYVNFYTTLCHLYYCFLFLSNACRYRVVIDKVAIDCVVSLQKCSVLLPLNPLNLYIQQIFRWQSKLVNNHLLR